MLWDRGIRTTPAPKPRQGLDTDTERLLDFLADVRPSGWIPASCAMLDISSETREQLHKQIAEARERAATRGSVQRGTLVFGEATRPFLLIWLVVPDEGRSALQDLLRDLADERLGEHGVQPVVRVRAPCRQRDRLTRSSFENLRVGEPLIGSRAAMAS